VIWAFHEIDVRGRLEIGLRSVQIDMKEEVGTGKGSTFAAASAD
jgi:hypothetical protein